MTRDDIIRMAREAGATPYTNRHYPDRTAHAFGPEALERFVALVAAAERVKLRDEIWDKAMKLVGEATKLEREACALACESIESDGYPTIEQQQCANAIRDRENT
jgi:hypothetical protein